MRQVNTRFFLVLLAVCAACAATLFGADWLQAGNITNALLWQCAQAEKNGKPDVAARYLGRYLDFAPDDVEQRAHLAAILSDANVALTPASRNRAIFVINQVLAWDPLRHELNQSLCRLAMANYKMDLAKEHLDYLQRKLPDSGNVAFLLGQWYERTLQERHATAAPPEIAKLKRDIQKQYEKAIEAEPRKVEAYVQLVALSSSSTSARSPATPPRSTAAWRKRSKNVPDDAAVLSLAAQRRPGKRGRAGGAQAPRKGAGIEPDRAKPLPGAGPAAQSAGQP